MAARRARRLKVYRTELGFFDTVVAAPNQSAALEAWGVHQNLFAEHRAAVTADAAAALLRRGPLGLFPGAWPPRRMARCGRSTTIPRSR